MSGIFVGFDKWEEYDEDDLDVVRLKKMIMDTDDNNIKPIVRVEEQSETEFAGVESIQGISYIYYTIVKILFLNIVLSRQNSRDEDETPKLKTKYLRPQTARTRIPHSVKSSKIVPFKRKIVTPREEQFRLIKKTNLEFPFKRPKYTGNLFLQDILRPVSKDKHSKKSRHDKDPRKGGGYHKKKRKKTNSVKGIPFVLFI